MMEQLTSKQKSHLRSLGQNLKPLCIIGKAGLTESLKHNIDALLEQHELVKVRIPAGPGPQREATAEELASSASAELVGVIGRTVLLYRPSPKLARRIALP